MTLNTSFNLDIIQRTVPRSKIWQFVVNMGRKVFIQTLALLSHKSLYCILMIPPPPRPQPGSTLNTNSPVRQERWRADCDQRYCWLEDGGRRYQQYQHYQQYQQYQHYQLNWDAVISSSHPTSASLVSSWWMWSKDWARLMAGVRTETRHQPST